MLTEHLPCARFWALRRLLLLKAVRWLLSVRVTEKLNTRGPGNHLTSQQSFAFLGEGTGPRYQTPIPALGREGACWSTCR